MITAPRELRASLPAELRGLRRDGARLCVVERDSGRITHTTVAEMGEHLRAGDLLVVNSSRTLPAALTVSRASGEQVQLRPAALRAGEWDALAVETGTEHRNVGLRRGEILSHEEETGGAGSPEPFEPLSSACSARSQPRRSAWQPSWPDE